MLGSMAATVGGFCDIIAVFIIDDGATLGIREGILLEILLGCLLEKPSRLRLVDRLEGATDGILLGSLLERPSRLRLVDRLDGATREDAPGR